MRRLCLWALVVLAVDAQLALAAVKITDVSLHLNAAQGSRSIQGYGSFAEDTGLIDNGDTKWQLKYSYTATPNTVDVSGLAAAWCEQGEGYLAPGVSAAGSFSAMLRVTDAPATVYFTGFPFETHGHLHDEHCSWPGFAWTPGAEPNTYIVTPGNYALSTSVSDCNDEIWEQIADACLERFTLKLPSNNDSNDSNDSSNNNNVVPEPTTFMIWTLFGLAGMVAALNRRRKAG